MDLLSIVKIASSFTPKDRAPTIYKDKGYIRLSNGAVATFDTNHFADVSKHRRWFNCNGYPSFTNYNTDGTKSTIRLHQVVHPNSDLVDHINGNRLDNTDLNLREATYKQNNANRGRVLKSISTYKGVTWDKSRNKWLAQIEIGGHCKHLGRYSNESDAAKIYNEAAKAAYGEFARLNDLSD